MAPARILACEPQHQLPHFSRQRWPSTASPKARPTTTAAGDKRRPPAGLDQLRKASAAPLGGGESRARAVTPAARGLSHAARGGYEPAHPAEPEQRDKGRRGPCRRSSQPSPDRRGDTNIGALQVSRRRNGPFGPLNLSRNRRRMLVRASALAARG